MKLIDLLKLPYFWLASVLLGLVLVLALWYVQRPADAEGRSLILRPQGAQALRRDLPRQAARRAQDSVRATHAEQAATDLYHQGQQAEASARRLHHRAHETTAPADTTAAELQRKLADY